MVPVFNILAVPAAVAGGTPCGWRVRNPRFRQEACYEVPARLQPPGGRRHY